jgi:hypothetical protein
VRKKLQKMKGDCFETRYMGNGLRAVQELMMYLSQDPEKLDKASKGFFNVS